MPLKIPQSDEPSLAKFFALSDQSVESLIAALRDCPPTLTRRDLAKQIATKAALDPDTARAVVRVLIALYSTYSRRKSDDIDQFTEEVRSTLEKMGRPELRPKSGDWGLFKDRLKTLLSLDRTLGVTSKALDVSMDHQYWLCDCRILSEIRPVFSQDPEALPSAAVVGHVLKLTCHEGNGMRDFFIGMDSTSLHKLSASIDRALKKDRTLQGLLQKAGVLSLQAETE